MVMAVVAEGIYKLEGVDIIVILYFKARYLKCNILVFYLNSFKLNVKLV